jgi:hypothetical protein
MICRAGILNHPVNRPRRLKIGRKIGRTLFEPLSRTARRAPSDIALGFQPTEKSGIDRYWSLLKMLKT